MACMVSRKRERETSINYLLLNGSSYPAEGLTSVISSVTGLGDGGCPDNMSENVCSSRTGPLRVSGNVGLMKKTVETPKNLHRKTER